MANKYLLAGAMAAFLAAASIAHAPTKNISYQPPKGIIPIENSLEKFVKESEQRFLKSWYEEFPFPEEISDILKHARLYGLEPELLMAIRAQENGVDSIAYGVMHNGSIKEIYEKDKGYIDNGIFYFYKDEKEKQLDWSAGTVRYYLNQFNKNPKNKNKDFISFLGHGYSPTENDSYGLNKYWIPNVKEYYKRFKRN